MTVEKHEDLGMFFFFIDVSTKIIVGAVRSYYIYIYIYMTSLPENQ